MAGAVSSASMANVGSETDDAFFGCEGGVEDLADTIEGGLIELLLASLSRNHSRRGSRPTKEHSVSLSMSKIGMQNTNP